MEKDPFKQFSLWYGDVLQSGVDLPNAFTLSTASRDGEPSSRVLLLKGCDERGFTFYTNSLSRKARQMKFNPRASMCFFWNSLERQIRIEGRIGKVGNAEADEYFAQRPRGSKIGAWASHQGEILRGREELEEKFSLCDAEFSNSAEIPRPPFWNGYRLIPSVFEFWQGRKDRMHDRIRYGIDKKRGDWTIERLAP